MKERTLEVYWLVISSLAQCHCFRDCVISPTLVLLFSEACFQSVSCFHCPFLLSFLMSATWWRWIDADAVLFNMTCLLCLFWFVLLNYCLSTLVQALLNSVPLCNPFYHMNPGMDQVSWGLCRTHCLHLKASSTPSAEFVGIPKGIISLQSQAWGLYVWGPCWAPKHSEFWIHTLGC